MGPKLTIVARGFIPAGLRSSPHPARPLLQTIPTHRLLFIPMPKSLHPPTHPCAFTYNYARTRPLVRLAPGSIVFLPLPISGRV
jgi:hypothetical protein